MTAQIAATPDAESGSALISPRRRNFVFLAIMLTRSPNFEGSPDRAEVEAALERIAQRIVVQPDWGDDPRRGLSAVATERIPIAASGVPSRHEPNRNVP